MASGEHREATALRPRHHHQGAIEIRLSQGDAALLGQTHHPVALLLQGFQGAVEVHHPGHGQIFEGAGGHLGHRAREAGAAALGQHQAMGAEGLGAAHDRPQVVGIGEAINGHQQGRFTDVTATADQAV